MSVKAFHRKKPTFFKIVGSDSCLLGNNHCVENEIVGNTGLDGIFHVNTSFITTEHVGL